MSTLWSKFSKDGEVVGGGVLSEDARPDIADMVHGIDTLSVIVQHKDGSWVQYTRGPEPEGDDTP